MHHDVAPMGAPDNRILLRDYQQQQIDDIRKAFRRARKVLLQSPTGSGKTTVFSWLTQATARRGKRICITAHRKEILRQISARLDQFGVDHDLVDSKTKAVSRKQVVVASIGTLVRRLAHYGGTFDLMVTDEAHHAVANQYRTVAAAYPEAFHLGVTATPERLDGTGLGECYDELVLGPEVRWLIEQGYLADYVVYAPPEGGPNLRGVKTSMGDYAKKSLADVMASPDLVGDAVDHYRRLAHGLPAVVFSVSVEQALADAEAFKAAGYRFEAVHGDLEDDERDRRMAAIATGELQGIVSCDLISEGVDVPGLSVAILRRPTKSLALHLQQVGRVLRPKPDGSRAIILDHAGNITRLGFPDQPRVWTLDSRPRRERQGESGIPVKTCEDCLAVLPSATATCPHCGHAFEPAGRQITTREGELVEVTPQLFFGADGRSTVERRKQDIDAAIRRCNSWKDLVALRKSLGFKPGWDRKVAASIGWKPIKNAQGYPFMYVPPSRAA